jgi:hypothetical protein
MSTQTELEPYQGAHDRLYLFAMRVSTYLFVSALAVFAVWTVLLVSIIVEMSANRSFLFGGTGDPGLVEWAYAILTFGTTYPVVVTILGIAGAAVRLYAHGQAAKLERHDELLDALDALRTVPQHSPATPTSRGS